MNKKIKSKLLNVVRAFLRLFPAKWHSSIVAQIEAVSLYNKYVKTGSSYNSEVGTIEKIIQPSIEEQRHPREEELIGKVIESYNSAKKKQDSISSVYLPSNEWKKIVQSSWASYSGALANGDNDEMKGLLRNFFRNEGINGLWGYDRMFFNFSRLRGLSELRRMDIMIKQYKVWRNFSQKTPLKILEVPNIGNPWGYSIDGVRLFEPVFEYHFQAAYLTQLIDKIVAPVVLEIGGGFGGLGYFLRKMKPTIKYIGIDLPENILIQTYYLSTVFPEARIFTYGKDFSNLTADIVNSHDIILLPNFALPKIESSIADLVVNVRSLSEMSLETISTYLAEIDRIGRLFFFHENIFEPRQDGYHGIPSTMYPALGNFVPIASSESRWPKYNNASTYPCHENLLIHKNAIASSVSLT